MNTDNCITLFDRVNFSTSLLFLLVVQNRTMANRFVILTLFTSILAQSNSSVYNAPVWTQISCIPGVASQSTAVTCVLAQCSGTICQSPNPIVYSNTYPITLQRVCNAGSTTSGCKAVFCEYATAKLTASCTTLSLQSNTDGSETAIASLSGAKISCGFISGNMTLCSTSALAGSSSGSAGLVAGSLILTAVIGSFVLF
jgi:hypothetical protein